MKWAANGRMTAHLLPICRVTQDLSSLVDELRRADGDSTSVEVKAAARGFADV
jgi:hypothetical protein